MSSQSHDLPIVDGEQIRSVITIPPNGGREGELVLTPENVLLRKILEVDGFSSNTIETYNNWICNVLPRQISARSIKTEDGIVTFENALLLPQCEVIDGKTGPLTPLIVRERGQPYLANLYADLVFTPQNNATGILTSTPSRSNKVSSRRRIRLGSIPAMLGSQTCWLYGKSATERVAMGECYTDPFGYFIIKGEKAILTQEKLRSSMFLTMIADVKGRVEGRITCNTILGTTIVTLLIGKKWQTLKVGLQHLGKQHHIPLFVLYRLFGYTFEMAWDMIKKFITDPKTLNRVYIVLQSSVAKAEGIPNPIDYLMNKIPRKSDDSSTGSNTGNIQQEIRDNIVKNLFAHIPNDPSKPEASIREKLLHMSLMTAKMCEYLIGQRMLDDRDSWSNKRLESAGRSMEQLFNGLWEKMTREAQENINKGRFTGIDAVEKTLNQSTLTDEFISSFGSNSWGVKGSYVKENITESLKRDTPLAVYSQIGRVNTPASRQAKQPAIRMVQPSQLGYICLTGDTEVLLEDGITTKQIKDMDNNDRVLTANPITLEESGSAIKGYFKIIPDKVLQITTLSHRQVKSSPDHPFLVARSDGVEWVHARDLKVGDYLIIRNCTAQLPTSGELLMIKSDDIIPRYLTELRDNKLVDLEINEDRMSILARLVGACWTDGHLSERKEYGGWSAEFHVGEESDAYELIRDIKKLGFDVSKPIYRTTEYTDHYTGNTTKHSHYKVCKGGGFANILKLLGVPVGKKGDQHSPLMPQWILNASLNVKREFLSGFQGGDGGRITMARNGNNYKVLCGATQQTCSAEFQESHQEFINQIAGLFAELGVSCFTSRAELNGKLINKFYLNNTYENIYRYSSLIGYRYCSEKTRHSALPIEFIRYKVGVLNDKQRVHDQINILNKSGMRQCDIARRLQVDPRVVSRSIGRGPNYQVDTCAYSVLTYPEFTSQVLTYDRRVYVQITDIREVDVEPVYDFTTISENHSFYANGVLVRNCPFETPEGEGNGLVKNLALTCYLSQERNPSIIRGILMMAEFSAVQSLDKTSDHAHPILLNSRIVGWCNGPVLRDLLVGARRKALIAKDVCIFFHPRDRILEIYCDGARPTRPLLVVENGTLVIDRLELWNESLDTLLRTGCIEYIDAREQEYVKLAMSPAKVREHTENGGLLRLQYEIANTHNLETKAEILDRIKEWENIEPFTHSEIDPIAMFSIACGLIPMANREQGPRITYQASMGKQALGQYHTNHHLRFDTTFKMLLWSTRPTFETEVAEPAGLNLMPTGQTVITAFLALRNNGEDAIVVKEEAIAAGKFEVMKYMTHKAVVKKTSDVIETFCRPEAKGSNVGRYAAIDENGLPRLDAYIKQGDCIIGRIREYTKTGVRENASIFAGVGEEGYVDRIHITRNLERYYVAKVKIRQKREYRVGDKLSSRYSQKGVIAVVIPAHQLPRISGGPNDGVVPDFFVNPHSIPSRMTMGKMIEMLACKAALYTGERVNATSFRAFDIQRYRQILTNRGMDPDGYEKMVHPDGTPLQTPVFVGPCYYQALRHHVLDKFQMRSRGAIDPLSHQPVSGRANEGGLRFGEMERDGLISHAASSILLERLCTVSDAYKTIICSNCGSICIAGPY